MSAPVYEFSCTQCDFKGVYASGTGAWVYLVPAGSFVHVPWDTGWCSHCKTIRRIEKGISPVEVEAERRRLEAETRSNDHRESANWETLLRKAYSRISPHKLRS